MVNELHRLLDWFKGALLAFQLSTSVEAELMLCYLPVTSCSAERALEQAKNNQQSPAISIVRQLKGALNDICV